MLTPVAARQARWINRLPISDSTCNARLRVERYRAGELRSLRMHRDLAAAIARWARRAFIRRPSNRASINTLDSGGCLALTRRPAVVASRSACNTRASFDFRYAAHARTAGRRTRGHCRHEECGCDDVHARNTVPPFRAWFYARLSAPALMQYRNVHATRRPYGKNNRRSSGERLNTVWPRTVQEVQPCDGIVLPHA